LLLDYGRIAADRRCDRARSYREGLRRIAVPAIREAASTCGNGPPELPSTQLP
jgi:hypothetical protein